MYPFFQVKNFIFWKMNFKMKINFIIKIKSDLAKWFQTIC